MNKLSGIALLVACIALALNFVPRSGDTATTSTQSDEPETLTTKILAKGLGYSWHPIDLQGAGTANMIGVSRSTNGKFPGPSGASASLPDSRDEPLYLFYKVEENWLHYSVVSEKSQLSSKLPLLLPTDAGPRGASASTTSGTPIQIGTEFLSIDTTDGEGDSSTSLPPDYEAGNVGFAVFVK